MENTDLRIDIRKVLDSKNPKLRKYLPNFVVEYLRRIVHEDEVNYILDTYGHMEGIDFVDAYMKFFDVHINARGVQQVPTDKKYIFAANHPMGGHDGVLIMKAVDEHFGKSLSMINDLLMNLKPLRPLFMGVNLHGGNSRDAVRVIDEAFNSDNQITIFPAGLVSRRNKGIVADLEWKKTVIARAVRHKRDVVPLHISGQNSNFFYNLFSIRKKLGVKMNIEMLYLVDELFRKRGQTFDFTFGKPIPYTAFDKSRSQDEWANVLRDHVYQLPKNPAAEFGKL